MGDNDCEAAIARMKFQTPQVSKADKKSNLGKASFLDSSGTKHIAEILPEEQHQKSDRKATPPIDDTPGATYLRDLDGCEFAGSVEWMESKGEYGAKSRKNTEVVEKREDTPRETWEEEVYEETIIVPPEKRFSCFWTAAILCVAGSIIFNFIL